MYKVKFKDENKYTGEYGPVMFVEGEAKVTDNWIAAWFKGNGFVVEKIEEEKAPSPLDIKDLNMDQLKEIAKEKGIEGYSKMKKEELFVALKGGEYVKQD